MSVQNPSETRLETGRRIGAIIQDETERDRLISNPQTVLAEIGVETSVKVYADTADMVHLVVPAHIDQSRVAADDAAYFEELGLLALGLCMYSDQPDEQLT